MYPKRTFVNEELLVCHVCHEELSHAREEELSEDFSYRPKYGKLTEFKRAVA
jgi:hypothetical protein